MRKSDVGVLFCSFEKPQQSVFNYLVLWISNGYMSVRIQQNQKAQKSMQWNVGFLPLLPLATFFPFLG